MGRPTVAGAGGAEAAAGAAGGLLSSPVRRSSRLALRHEAREEAEAAAAAAAAAAADAAAPPGESSTFGGASLGNAARAGSAADPKPNGPRSNVWPAAQQEARLAASKQDGHLGGDERGLLARERQALFLHPASPLSPFGPPLRLLFAVAGLPCWAGVAWYLLLAVRLQPSLMATALQRALWLSQVGLLCLALAFDACKKAFVMGSMLALLPALLLQFQGLDLEPTIVLMHIVSSLHFHAVQDLRKPMEVHTTHETLAFLDYFWANLDISPASTVTLISNNLFAKASCLVYLADIRSRRLKVLIYFTFIYSLMAALFKDRRARIERVGFMVLGGGLSVALLSHAVARQVPQFQWGALPVGLTLLAFAAYNFLVLQNRHPNLYWLHHGLWHAVGNASILAFVGLRRTDYL
eukprot:SM000171S03236  [mRNA]  locus=s171:179133:181385:- [translate_table: standard]